MQAAIVTLTAELTTATATFTPLKTAWDAAEVTRLAAEETAAIAAEGVAWTDAKARRDAEKTLLDEMEAEFGTW